MRVASEELVGAFAGEDYLVSCVANGAAEEIFGDAVGVDAEGLGLEDGVGEVVGEIVLMDGYGEEVGAGSGRHLFRLFLLVVLCTVEGEGEGADGFRVMFRREAEDGAGVEAAAEIAADGDIGAKTKPHGFLEDVAKFGGVVGIGALRRGGGGAGVVEVPVLVDLNVLVRGEEEVTGRDLKDTVVESAHLRAAGLGGVGKGVCIPAGRDAGGKERFYFGGEVEGFVMEGVEEGLDAEAVASGEEGAVSLIPEDEGELAAQAMKTLGTEILIEVQGDFTIGASAQVMPGLFQFALDGFVAVELAIDDDVNAAIFAGDGLVAGGEVDDAEAGVAQGDFSVGGDPVAPAVGATVVEALRGSLKGDFGDGITTREQCDDSAHAAHSCLQFSWVEIAGPTESITLGWDCRETAFWRMERGCAMAASFCR